MTIKFSILLLSTTLALTACGGDKSTQSQGSQGASDVTARQALMKDWYGASEILKGMSEDPSRFDAAVLQEQAKFLSESSSKMWTHFGDANQKGKAQDVVWSDAEGFKTAIQNFNTAATNLNTVAQTAKSADEIGTALGQLGESCGGCHKVFKQK